MSLNGFEVFGGTDGSIIIGLGLLIGLLGLVGASDARWSSPIRLLSLGAAIVIGFIAVNDLGTLQKNAATINAQGSLNYLQGYGTAHASVALGLYVIGVAVLLTTIGVLASPPRK